MFMILVNTNIETYICIY